MTSSGVLNCSFTACWHLHASGPEIAAFQIVEVCNAPIIVEISFHLDSRTGPASSSPRMSRIAHHLNTLTVPTLFINMYKNYLAHRRSNLENKITSPILIPHLSHTELQYNCSDYVGFIT